ncbi:tyrosine-type recombinase/integrase [Terrabacter sp. 2YAF2]|uniref:tyrosine-type recombinase/integrase n=1 Tax=Terrabacter sp. 2YAF2 TaxID=3233026 RepID=UPI003F98406A
MAADAPPSHRTVTAHAATDPAAVVSDGGSASSGSSGVSAGAASSSSVDAAVGAARRRWEEGSEFTDQTLARVGETITRFGARLRAQGVEKPEQITSEHCRGFITARTAAGRPAELTTQHTRRNSLRMLFRTWRELGLTEGDPTLDLSLPPRSDTSARPLTDTEVILCRAATRLGEAGTTTLQRAVAWALGEATAVSSEISTIRLADLDDPDSPRWVHLPGTRRHDPRLGELSDWGTRIVTRQAQVLRSRHAPATTLLTYRGSGTPGQAKAQAAVCNALGAVLDLAGLSSEPDVRPASLRNWAGRTLFDGGMPLEQVARRMGARSLDTVAADLALEWRTT